MSLRDFQISFKMDHADIVMRVVDTQYRDLVRQGLTTLGEPQILGSEKAILDETIEYESNVEGIDIKNKDASMFVNQLMDNLFGYLINQKSVNIIGSSQKLTKRSNTLIEVLLNAKRSDINKYDDYPGYLLELSQLLASLRLPKRSGYLTQFVINSFSFKSNGDPKNPGISISYQYPLNYPTIIKGKVKHFGEVGRTGSKLYPSEYYTPIVVRTTPKTKLVILNDPEASAYPMFKINQDLETLLVEDITDSIESLRIEIDIKFVAIRDYKKGYEEMGKGYVSTSARTFTQQLNMEF
jgi:hypothetical protein